MAVSDAELEKLETEPVGDDGADVHGSSVPVTFSCGFTHCGSGSRNVSWSIMSFFFLILAALTRTSTLCSALHHVMLHHSIERIFW